MSAAPTWRVAIIDDSPEDLAEARRLLLRGSGRRYHFMDGETAAAAVRLGRGLGDPAGPPDCLVLDYHLPDATALEVLTELTLPDGLPACPVVVVTGQADPDSGRAALRGGAQDFLGKGWMTAESLTRAVENAIERWALQRRLVASERRFRAVFDQQFQYALLLSPDGTVRDASSTSLEGTPPDEVYGQPVWATPWWRDLPTEGERLRAAVQRAVGGQVDRFEVGFHSSRGGLRQADVLVKPLYAAGGAVDGVLIEGHDITDQRVIFPTKSGHEVNGWTGCACARTPRG